MHSQQRRQTDNETESERHRQRELVFYAQSTTAVISWRETDRQTDRHTDRQTDRQTEKEKKEKNPI